MSFGSGSSSQQEPKTTKVQIVGNEASQDTSSAVNRRQQDNQDDGIPQATLLGQQSPRKKTSAGQSRLLG